MSVLEFDSDWFGVRVGRYDNDPIEADRWAKENSVGCLFTLLPIEQIAKVYDATQRGFRLTDVRVEFVATPSRQTLLREADASERSVLQRIAKRSYQKTRFHNDRNFDRARVDAMYANWLLTTKGTVFIAEEEVPVGFVVVGDTHLELIAVDEHYRGSGHGLDLTRSALGLAFKRGQPELRVVTQSGNHAAQRTFQAAGFRLDNTSLWLHKWYQ